MKRLNKLAKDKCVRLPVTLGFAQFGLPPLAHHLLVLLIICSNLALANRVFSGQASSRITDYPNCAKPGTLVATLGHDTTDNKPSNKKTKVAVGDKQKLMTEIVSKVLNEQAQTSKKFDWFINKHSKENFGKYFSIIDKIFKSLNGDINANQTKRSVALDCDAYFGGEYNFIFEFDEFQHFSSARLKTIEHYPTNLKLNFDLKTWKNLCLTHKNRADNYRKTKTTTDFNFDGGRTAQRAYLDCFRDLLPEVQELNPTLRINEFEVIGITKNDKEACNRIEQLIKTKLS